MNSKKYTFIGIALCALAACFAAYALSHPELSFPWPNWVSYTLYGFYAVFTVLIFCMPKFTDPSLFSCVILAVQFAALSLIVISVGMRKTPNENNWYLPVGLLLTCVGNFANAYRSRKKGQKKK